MFFQNSTFWTEPPFRVSLLLDDRPSRGLLYWTKTNTTLELDRPCIDRSVFLCPTFGAGAAAVVRRCSGRTSSGFRSRCSGSLDEWTNSATQRQMATGQRLGTMLRYQYIRYIKYTTYTKYIKYTKNIEYIYKIYFKLYLKIYFDYLYIRYCFC